MEKKMRRAKTRGLLKSVTAKVLLWLFLSVVVSLTVYFVFLKPTPEVRTVEVTIKAGLNTAEIADLLVKKGVVGNEYVFRAFAALTQTEARMQPGKYKFRTDMTYEEILDKLTKVKKREYVRVVIPEGFTVTQIADRLAEKTDRPAVDFLEYMRGQGLAEVRPDDLPQNVGTIEGYLFPKTYDFEKKAHPRKIVQKLVGQYQEETDGLDWKFAREHDRSVHEIMTVASLIEREAKVPGERPLMAAVIYNRLNRGMALQLCSTVQYVLPKQKDVLTNDDLKIASPYNTYQNIGLPPGPISNPGIASIKAALAPADVDYIYFVLTSEDGRHTFTNNYQEFEAAKKRMP